MFPLGVLHSGSRVGLGPLGALSWGLLILSRPRAPASAESALIGWVWGESLRLHSLWPWTTPPLNMDGHPLVAFPYHIHSAKPFYDFHQCMCVYESDCMFECIARKVGTLCWVFLMHFWSSLFCFSLFCEIL